MTGNPLSGHTAANQASMTGSGVFTDSLEDGEHITSPSLTNMLEGVHGNGIILEEDTASTASIRDRPEDLPGVCEQTTNPHQISIQGGHAILDGVLYDFANGYSGASPSSIDIKFNSTSLHYAGVSTPSALTSGQEALIVVYISSDTANKCISWEMGTPVTTASNTYPTTPSAFLSNPKSGLDVTQTIVLAVIRVVYVLGSGDNDLNISITESNDKRVFVRPTPLYLTPVTTGAVNDKTAVDSHTALDALHSDTGNFTASRLGAIWQSYNSDEHANLYYSSKDSGGTRHTHLLGPTRIDVSSPSTNQTFTFGSNQVFVLTPSTTINLDPSGTFPPGYTVFVSVPSGSTVTFDSAGIASNVVATEATMFAYDGSAWKKVMVSGTISPASSGASGLVQLSDGAGGFTSDADLSWDAGAGELTIDGKLTVTGLIDPTGLELDPQAANPGGVAANTLWLDSGASNRPKIGSNAVMRASDNISELTNDAGFTDAAAAGAAAPVQSVNSATGAVVLDADDLADGATNVMMTTSERTKLGGIEANADVTDATNVQAAGALMDSEVTNLAAVKSFDPTAYATAAQGTLADSALQSVAFQHLRVNLTNNALTFGTNAGTDYFLQVAETSDYSNTGNTTDIVVTAHATEDYISLGAGGLYMVVVSVEIFTAATTAAQDFWLQLGNGTGSSTAIRNWGTARLKKAPTSTSSDSAVNMQKTVIIDVPSTGSDEKLYVAARVNNSNFTVRAYDNNRTNITVTRIGASTS